MQNTASGIQQSENAWKIQNVKFTINLDLFFWFMLIERCELYN